MSSWWWPRACGALAVAAVAVGLRPVISGTAWLLEALAAVVVVAAVGAGAQALPRPPTHPGLVVLAQLAALAVVLSLLFAPAQAVLGLLPGPSAWAELARVAGEGAEAVWAQGAPVAPGPGIRLFATAGAGLVAVLVDLLAAGLRRPALAGLPLLAVHSTAAVFAPGGLGAGWFVLAAVGYLLLLASDEPGRTGRWGRRVPVRAGAGADSAPSWPSAARAAAAVAVAAAVVVPALVPTVSGGAVLAGAGGGGRGGSLDSVDPLLDLRADLEADRDARVLRYRTDVPTPQPLRIVTVDTFDGDTWEPTAPEPAAQQDLRSPLTPPPGLDPATPTRPSRYEVDVEALRQQWLPVPYPPTRVDVDGDWRFDPATLNVLGASGTRTRAGQEYVVDYLEVTPSAEQLATAPPAPEDVVAAYGAAPADLPPLIAQTAQEVAGDEQDPYARAVALQTYFRSGGGFTYTHDAPEPDTSSALADFLADKEGYCTHYASAMAVMARTLGIPARVAVGFLPGQEVDDGEWEITLRDAHAWPELYFAGAGWVRFEPTPGTRSGAVPGWTVPPVAAPVPSAAAAPSAAAPAPAPQRADEGGGAADVPDASAAPAASGLPWQVPVVAALVAGVLAAPLVSRSVVRRHRWQRAATPAQRAEAAWADLVEQVGDLGVPLAASATPRQVGRQLSGHGREEALGRLVTAVEASRYAPARGAGRAEDALAQDVRAVVGAIVADRPRAATWRWRVLPASGVAHLRRAARAVRTRLLRR
ncbi:DUF3488 and transglutaminase-like domain-containing protein [Quadrisphaera sp. DSM 44207]|uniref:transglutaminase family protein n=1 Tax=Quadrisphaera sp. DSM 44207 TaxID=1881057 RepID=UPI00087E9D0F|nr:DUF3488 and transglutaminase-like domain-containing protein [Quadrisphaera sp. DSM 44207]SDQ53892.1 Transglutaminase-like superfamily protein [Quadrisphaera sp. DSM 44207]